MPLFLTVLFLTFPFTDHPAGLYGSYRMADKGMLLNLSAPDNYTLFIMERDKKTGMVTSKELSRGSFAMEGDTLKLSEQLSNNTMALLVNAEEKLQAVSVKGLEKGDTFLQWSAHYENGQPRFEGSWRKGKKHGRWVYFDTAGNVQKTLEYRRGKLKNS